MNRRQIHMYQMLARVADFGATHAELFPKTTIAGELLAAIGSAVTKLSGHSSSQVSGNGAIRNSSGSRTAARKALKKRLEQIDQTARAMQIDKFWMPRKRAVQAIIDSGRAFARDAEPLRKQFIDHGLPETFIDDLNRAVHDLERAMLDQSVSRGSRASAIAGFNDTLNEALTLLQRFEALVSNTMPDNPEIMAAWNIARRVGRPPVSKRAEAETAPTA